MHGFPEPSISNLFFTLALMFGLSFIIGSAIKKVGLSPSIGYLLAGIVLGLLVRIPSEVSDLFIFLSEFSILLLFLEIGFEVHIENIESIRRFPLYISVFELLLALSTSLGILWLFDVGMYEALVYGLIAAFSSTVFTYKLLEDVDPGREEVKKTVLMVAAVEDAIIVIALSVIQGLRAQVHLSVFYVVAVMIALFVLSYEFTSRVLAQIMSFDVNGLILIISYGLFLGAFTSYMGLSSALGAFIAGVTASHITGMDKVMEMFKPVRSVFITLFLVSMGLNIFIYTYSIYEYLSALAMGVVLATIHVVATLTASVIAGGLGVKYGLETGLYLSTISELSLVITYYSMLNKLVPPKAVLTASIAIVFGAFVSSLMVHRKHYIVASILDKLSYNKLVHLDEIVNKLRRSVEERSGVVYNLFINFVHNVGEILLFTAIISISLKLVSNYMSLNLLPASAAIIVLYIAAVYRLYKRSKHRLYEILSRIEPRIDEKLLKLVDRIYTSLIVFLSTYTAITILAIEYYSLIEEVVRVIDPHVILLVALTLPPVMEIAYMIYRVRREQVSV